MSIHSEEQTMYQKQNKIMGLLVSAAFAIGLLGMIIVNPLSAEEKMSFTIKSTAFTDGGEIPSKYTCEGKDVSPPLTWEGVPGNTRSLVLIVDDPDAPDPKAPKMTWVHWVLYNIPSDVSGLVEAGTLPAGTEEGLNDWKRTGYGGPCPPIGRHRYFHKLYVLDIVLKGLSRPDKSQVEKAMKGHIIAKTELVGTYEK
jgi:Raf kinase inhibitor-like YbhB/YbcL family protein